jgi:hypothetical protein
MVKQITVIPVINNSNEENTEKVEDIINIEEDNKQVEENNIHGIENLIKLEDDETREKEEINTYEELPEKPKKGKKEMLNDMPTTEKVLTQVQCQACGKSMSAKNLKYSHAAYCIKRVQDVLDKPKAIPVPKKIIPKLKKTLPVKGVIQDEESDDNKGDVLKEDNLIIVDFDNKPKNKIINKNVKKKESNDNEMSLSDFNNMEILRLEALKKTTYEVRMKSARDKKQEKYDKLASNAF